MVENDLKSENYSKHVMVTDHASTFHSFELSIVSSLHISV